MKPTIAASVDRLRWARTLVARRAPSQRHTRAVLAVLLGIVFAGCGESGPAAGPRETTPLHLAAASGNVGDVSSLIAAGADANAADESGRTPLHLAAANGHGQTTAELLNAGADPNRVDDRGFRAVDYALENGHEETAGRLAAVTSARRGSPAPARVADDAGQIKGGLNPALRYPDTESFGRAVGAPAVHLSGAHVHVFAAESHEKAARIVLPYLDRAFAELERITGARPDYDLVVYHFSPGHPEAFGGTSNGTIWYDDTNLRLDEHEEWRTYGVPHVSGYIEEMAHNFVSASHVQFGWEMVGWSVGVMVTSRVAGNPLFDSSLASTRRTQEETFRRYAENGFVFPADIAPNLVDRIHAHLLYRAERDYGADFWPDFFAEVRKVQPQLREAAQSGDANAVRNARYRISVDCFDRLPGVNFKKLLGENGISLTTDVKSLDPTSPAWDRRLR